MPETVLVMGIFQKLFKRSFMLFRFCTLFALAALLGFPSLSAKHLAGGEITYRFLRVNAEGNFVYELTLNLYRDCLIPPGENQQTPFDDITVLGIYENVPSARKPLETGKAFSRLTDLTETDVELLPSNPRCDFEVQNCIRRGLIRGTVELPPSPNGYVLAFVRCCRNNPTNLVEDEGQTYYNTIPATSLRNSSPVFDNDPLPLVCTNDSLNLSALATDPDGDSLAYRLVQPYSGGTATDPYPYNNLSDLPASLILPPDEVRYRPGYSAAQPLGSEGTVDIDPITGEVSIFAQETGSFTYAVEVLEYRDGQLIGRTRRDYQIRVADCPPNPAPEIQEEDGSPRKRLYELDAGDTLDLGFLFTDTDSFTVKGLGELVEDSVPNGPQPQITLPSGNGREDKTARIYWPTSCRQAREGIYFINFRTSDLGCPPKVQNYSIGIKVRPFETARLLGPDSVCPFAENLTYRLGRVRPGLIRDWNVSGGVGQLNEDSTAITIEDWGVRPVDTITVRERNDNGCEGKLRQKIVNTYPLPEDTLLGPPAVCPNNTGFGYNVTIASNFSFTWSVVSGQAAIQSGANSDSAVVGYGPPDTVQLQVVRETNQGCRDTLSKPVVVGYQLETPPIFGPDSVCPFPEDTSFAYGVRPSGDAFYEWWVEGGAFAAIDSMPNKTVTWQGEDREVLLKVLEKSFDTVNKKICIGDTQYYPVGLAAVPRLRSVLGPEELCEGDTGAYQAQPANPAYLYEWRLNGRLEATTQGLVEFESVFPTQDSMEVSVSAINAEACQGPPQNLQLMVQPVPLAKTVLGPDTLCAGIPQPSVYRLPKVPPDSKLAWRVEGGSMASQQADSIQVRWPESPGEDTTRSITVVETNGAGCAGPENTLSMLDDYPQVEIVRVTTLPNDDDQIEIVWERPQEGAVAGRPFFIERAEGEDGAFANLNSTSSDTRRLLDPTARTSEGRYRYRVGMRNLCGYSVRSRPHGNVVLRSELPNPDDIALQWNSYQGWPAKPRYELLREIGSSLPADGSPLLQILPETFYTQSMGQQEGAKQCFRVRAKSPGREEAYSYSNAQCLTFEPLLRIPNAFTPNSDEINPAFRLYGYNLQDVRWTVYNRWGEELFTAEGLEAQWDGQCADGPCPEGEYLVIVRYTGVRGPAKRKQTIHLMR